MPSPIGHTIAGFCGYLLAPKGSIPKPQMNTLLASIVIANLPDIDILPGLLLGNPPMFHRQGTHSIAAGIIAGMLVVMLGRWQKLSKKSILKLGAWTTALYCSHIFLDLLVTDLSPPRGVQLLWPFSNAYFISPVTVFGGFDYFDPAVGMLRSMLNVSNLIPVLQELVLMTLIYGCIYYSTRHFKRG